MHAQHLTITMENADGVLEPAAGVTVTIYDDAAYTVLRTIYSDDGVTPIAGSVLITDATGYCTFWTTDGDYYFRVTSGPDTLLSRGPMKVLDLHDVVPKATSVARVERMMVAAAGATGLPTLAAGESCTNGQHYCAGLTAILKPHFDITHPAYGADPTGAVDSTTAIQNALNAANIIGSPIVYAPRGTYRFSRLTIPAGVTLLGDGQQRTIFQTTQVLGGSGTHFTTSAIAASTIGVSDSEEICVEGIRFERHSSVAGTADVMYFNISNMVRCRFRGLSFGVGAGTGVTWAFAMGNGASNGLMYAKMVTIESCKMVGRAGGFLDRFVYTRSDGGTGYCIAVKVFDCWLDNIDTPITWDGRTKSCLVAFSFFDGFDDAIIDGGLNNLSLENYFIDGSLGAGNAIAHTASSYQSKAIANNYDAIADADAFETAVGTFNAQAIDGGNTTTPNRTRVSRIESYIGDPGSPGWYGDLVLREVAAGGDRIYLGGSSSTTPQIILGTADPSAGGGVTAGIGSLYIRTGTLTFNSPRLWIKYDSAATNWMPVGDSYVTNAGTPVGAVTPTHIGQLCIDTSATPDDVFMSVGLANSDWEKLTP